jgi:hypothetical protein
VTTYLNLFSGLQVSFLQFNYINRKVSFLEYPVFSSVVECALSGGFAPSPNSEKISFSSCWIGFCARDDFNLKHSDSAGGAGREGVEGEPVECNILGVARNLDAWGGDVTVSGTTRATTVLLGSFLDDSTGETRGGGRGGGQHSISSSALDDEAGWRKRDPSWVDDVESNSSVNGSASYFELEWRGRIYAEGELANNIICCSAGTFDAEWGGRDGVGNESSDYSIVHVLTREHVH